MKYRIHAIHTVLSSIQVLRRALFLTAIVLVASTVTAQEASSVPVPFETTRNTEPTSPTLGSSLKDLARVSMDRLKEIIRKGEDSLHRLLSNPETDVDRSLREVQRLVCASAERARRLSEWNMENIQSDAEQAFDATIEAVQEYLALVADDGPIHEAAKRIRSAALDRQRAFREKADARGSKRYEELSLAMAEQADRASKAWEAIVAERQHVEEALKSLDASRELFIDVKVALGIEKAVKELESVKDDLQKLAGSLAAVQKAVGESAEKAAGRDQASTVRHADSEASHSGAD